ncbi:Esterase [Nesidiocoris tenuis]|uniref:Carboxylic ester hydrolase n=1 Tax=Nesidiocoris tenuis TaxID=355587 RepID=A0ABN7B8G2_9HEMI|nr:Esterase [Nesidiocoris tenuis]
MAGVPVLVSLISLVSAIFGEVIHTRLGDLEGKIKTSRDGREYSAWTKIPYAKPPVGNLRLANPEPFGKWKGVLNATENPPMCTQGSLFKLPRITGAGQEDCLYLSVYKPNIEAKNLPVLFYVHGGGFLLGHPGSENMANYLMDENVILVTTTYRLGPLGFLSLNDKDLPGNFGLKDQALALRWVYENIEDFGGDPESITVFGESAGGASVHHLLLSPLTRDMVSKAYAMSGVIQNAWSNFKPSLIKSNTEKVIDALNCKKGSVREILECLRAIKDPFVVTDAMNVIDNRDMDICSFGPTFEPAAPGAFATEDLSGAVSTKPLVLSFAAAEYLLYVFVQSMAKSDQPQRIKKNLDAYTRNVISYAWDDEEKLATAAKILRDHYFKSEEANDIFLESAKLQQDVAFVYPALEVAETHQGPKWVYQMVHRGEVSILDLFGKIDSKVAAHADDVLYLLDQRDKYTQANASMNEVDKRISKQMVKFLVNFAKHGNPTPDGSPLFWKQYKGNEILRVKTEGFVMGDDDFIREQKGILNLWRRLLNEKSAKEEL